MRHLLDCLAPGILVCLLGVTLPNLGDADDHPDAKSQNSAESDETTRLIKAELPNWKLWERGASRAELKLEPKSVLRWTNPGTGRVFGDLFLWTANGRPEVAMSLFKAWEPANGFHVELHSLSLSPVEAERSRSVIWQPEKPGVVLRDIPGAPVPAETPVRRLAQMRALAGEFSSVLTDFRRNDSGERQPLRLLTQPLYRYQSTEPALVDGAMFCFVLGTDPEVFLLLEARRSAEGARWQYGLARMNDDALAVLHKDQEVWRTDRAKSRDDLRDPYVLKKLPESSQTPP